MDYKIERASQKRAAEKDFIQGIKQEAVYIDKEMYKSLYQKPKPELSAQGLKEKKLKEQRKIAERKERVKNAIRENKKAEKLENKGKFLENAKKKISQIIPDNSIAEIFKSKKIKAEQMENKKLEQKSRQKLQNR